MREIVHIQAGQCGNQIGAKVSTQGNLKTFMRSSIENLYNIVCIFYSL